jgi:YhcH/YjgK/YiaL family protein
MALFGSLATVRAQAPHTREFATAFSYLEDLLRPGSDAAVRLAAAARGDTHRVELSSGVFAIEQVYDTKPRAEGFFESHRKYIDVQVIFSGEELMEVIEVSRATVRQPYVAERDFIVYDDAADASALRLKSGDAAIFFPVDVHMPSLQLHAGPVLVRKSVVKVPVV